MKRNGKDVVFHLGLGDILSKYNTTDFLLLRGD